MDDSRRILESCINEFFAPTTSNDRKRQIEIMLDNFSKQVGSWKQAIYFISTSSANQYVVMFCLSVIENSIKCRWLSMNPSEQYELKSTLYNFLIHETSLDSNSSIKNPQFIRNKIIKLLTDVGKFAWPQSYSDFFTCIFQLLENDRTVVIGLIFLKTVSEEWSVIKDEVSTDRKIQLKILLVEEMTDIFGALHRILLAALKQRATTLLHNVNSSPGQDAENSPPIHSQLDEIIALSLETTAHYCSWIPLDGSVHSLTDTKTKVTPFSVDFVQLVCQVALANLSDAPNSGNQISSLALAALNEILYRKFIPKEFDDQLNFVVRFGVELLNKLNRSIPSLETQYVEKVIEFLCLVASAHFHRLDETTAKAFMTLLLPFTFKQEETAFYYDCLEIWARLLDHLNAGVICSPSREDFLNQIKQPIMGLATGIIHSNAKFTFVYDEYYTPDEDEENDSPGISRNIDVLVKIGELLPAESLQSVTSTWADSCRFYLGLQAHMDQSNKVIRMENPSEIEHFNFVVQLIGRVANIFYGAYGPELSLGKPLFQQLMYLSVFSRQYYFVQSPHYIAQSNCAIICSLNTWTYWLSRYHAEVILAESTTLTEQRDFFDILGQLTDTVFYTLEHRSSIENRLLSTSSQFFATLVNSVRTQYLFQHHSVQALIENIHSLRASLDPDTYRVLNKAVASILLLPWYNVSQQEWELRTAIYTNYMTQLSTDLLIHASAVNLITGLHILHDQLSVLASECGSSKKMCWAVMKDLVPYLQDLSLGYLRLPNICEELLSFFLKIMEVLQQQAGASFFEHAVQNFLTYFSTENLIDDLLQEHENATYVVEKFLQMLQYMVKDSSASFKKFLPDALSICYDHIYPIISTRNSPDLKVPFFSLIRDAVNYRWSYFFPNLVLQQSLLHGNGGIRDTATSTAGNSGSSQKKGQPDAVAVKRLDQVLQSLGQSFLQSDFEVFRFNLATLLSWNDKHNFFTKLASQFSEIFDQFMMVLFQVLVQKSHDLLREEVAVVLYEMARVDFINFHQQFLPTFLSSNFLMLNKEQRDNLIGKFGPSPSSHNKNTTTTNSGGASCVTSHHHDMNESDDSNHFVGVMDSPTFTISLSKFIDDLRFFHFVLDCDRLNNQQSSQQSMSENKSTH